MTFREAQEYLHYAAEAEGEQRAEYGMGCVSLGYDPGEWGAAYEGYRTAGDPQYAEAQAVVKARQDALAAVGFRVVYRFPSLRPLTPTTTEVPF